MGKHLSWQRLRQFLLPARRHLRALLKPLTPRLGKLIQHPTRPLRIERHLLAPPQCLPAPRISIVTPSFNQGQFLERTILSVLEQSYPNLEYRIQDGGSTDGTREILERYSPRLSGWISAPDAGQANAINQGFSLCDGEIMAWLNSDDLLLPGTLAYVGDYFSRHPNVDAIYGHRILINEHDLEIGRWILPEHDNEVLSWEDYIPQETLFWRRALWNKTGGGIEESLQFAMDWDLLLRFRAAGANFARVPRFLGCFRVHPNQKSIAQADAIGEAEIHSLRTRTLGHTPSRSQIDRATRVFRCKHLLHHAAWRIRAAFQTKACPWERS